MGDGHEEREGYDPAAQELIDREQDRLLEDAGPIEPLSLVGREQLRTGFMAREHEREDHPELKLPSPEEVLGKICPYCHGTTWVVRANAEIPGPIMAQLEPCDNPDGCPQIKTLGQREIVHLALPHNHFNRVVTLPNGSMITALAYEG